MTKKTIADVQCEGKTVLMRVDFNVPIADGKITDDNRIQAALPSIQYVLDAGGKLVLFSHLGKIKVEADKAKHSLRPVADRLAELLDQDVQFATETRGPEVEAAVKGLKAGKVLLIENTRFEDVPEKKESGNDDRLGAYWASLGDVFINDAFGTAHREHASNVGIANHSAQAVAGFLMEKELKFLGQAIDEPERPFVAILGGAKVSDKINVIEALLKKADEVLIGGAMAYTFLAALGYETGRSLVERDKIDLAKTLLEQAGDRLILPVDLVVAPEISADAEKKTVALDEVPADWQGVDIGEKTVQRFKEHLQKAKTVVWNGPMGVFEIAQFACGTNAICEVIGNLEATTIIGGGDSASAAKQSGFAEKFTHISTGGGASMRFLEGSVLPGVASLTDEA